MPIKGSIIHRYLSGLDQDVSVSTFYSAGDTSVGVLTAFGTFITDLFQDDSVDSAPSIHQLMSGYVDRSATTLRLVSFNPATGKEDGEPSETPITMAAASNTTNLPQEVAFCLSYNGAFTSTNKGRNRGRVFLGPWNNGMNTGTSDDPSRPSTGLAAAILGRAASFADDANGEGAQISLYSPTDGSLKLITDFSYDDEWDTQRRRGLKKTFRIVYPVAPLP
uniref:Uncharacterized protein n=1 Tax=uncultured prokaryote TaxID=198431 RepID=A0A0H5Q631_9ZZZZ|nr:hypothetical protein [uncultured prokaryote]